MKRQMLKNLEALKAIPPERRDNDKGICSYGAGIDLCGFIEEKYKTLSKIFEQWPLHSGDMLCPVPSTKSNLTPEDAYNLLDLWQGEYGELREQLLDFTIKYLKEELDNE